MSLDSTQYEALAEQIESILQDPETVTAQIRDAKLRRRLVEGGRKLATSLEQPKDTLSRIGYSVCRIGPLVHGCINNGSRHKHLQLPLALIGVESGGRISPFQQYRAGREDRCRQGPLEYVFIPSP